MTPKGSTGLVKSAVVILDLADTSDLNKCSDLY